MRMATCTLLYSGSQEPRAWAEGYAGHGWMDGRPLGEGGRQRYDRSMC